MQSRRSFLIATASLVSGIALNPALAASPQPFNAQAFVDAQKAGRPILLWIHASWCPTCKAQTPILQQLTDDPKFKDLAYFVIDFDTQKDLLQRFRVRTQSTLIVFNGSAEGGRSVGDTNRVSISSLLNKAV